MATSIADILKAARENIGLVAEAEARLAAAGKVSLSTWEKQAKAIEYLSGRQRLNENQTKKLGQNTIALTKAFGDVEKAGLIAAATLTGTFAELRHLTGAAQPGMLHALDGALQILTAELGSALLPVAMDVADEILNLAEWFASLDDATKALIAGGVLALPAMIGLGHVINTLGPAARLAGIGVRFLYTSLGPIGALVAGIGVAAAGAAASVAAYHSALGQATTESAGKAGQVVTESELHQAINRIPWSRTREIVFQNNGTVQQNVQQALNANPEELKELSQRAREKAAKLRASGLSSEAKPAANKLEELANLFDRMAVAGKKTSEEERREAKQEGLMRQARHYNAMITEAQRIAKPSYSGLSEARKQLQLNALGKSPIEQQLLRIQQRNIPKMKERLDGILRQLEEMNNRDKRPT